MKRHFILFSSPSQTPQITWSLIEQSFYHCSLGLINFNDYIAKNIIRYICIFIFFNTIHSFIILQYLRLHFSMFFLSKVNFLVCSVLRNAGTLVWCKVFFVFYKRNVLKSCFKCILWLHYMYHYMYKYMALIKLIL